jgi:hypothetical protein
VLLLQFMRRQEPGLQDATSAAQQFMEQFERELSRDRGRDAVVYDDSGTIMVVEAKRWQGPISAQRAASSLRDAVRLINASPREVVIDLAASYAISDRDNADALERVSSTIRKAGLPSVSPGVLLIIILAWLLAVGVPVALPELPAGAQTTVVGELATLPIAMVITGSLLKRKDDNK